MTQRERDQLQAELDILRQLRHPNIVAYTEKEHFKATQDLHLYMEYCGNGDLGRYIKNLKQKNQFATESFVWNVFTQLATALYRCHNGQDPPQVDPSVMGLENNTKPIESKKGHIVILHRDLKPENGMFFLTSALCRKDSFSIVFLDKDNSVKLGDFGLSKIMVSHDFASTYVGTPFYMSPEICMAERYIHYSDIWSLGCIMYELCAKEPPFNAKSHFELIQKIKVGNYAPIPIGYSAELRKTIESCLRVNPYHRPDTIQLIGMPMMTLVRKEQEVAKFAREVQEEKRIASLERHELREKMKLIEAEQSAFRGELEDRLRREWEVKACLEINRQVKLKEKELMNAFDQEVKLQLEERLTTALLKKDQNDVSSPNRDNIELQSNETTSTDLSPDNSSLLSTVNTPSNSTDAGSLSTRPSTAESTHNAVNPVINQLKSDNASRPVRTPYGRTQSMFIGTFSPADVQMMDRSPTSFAEPTLSSRRTRVMPPDCEFLKKNIFATASKANKELYSDKQPFKLLSVDSETSDTERIDEPGNPESPLAVRMSSMRLASRISKEERESSATAAHEARRRLLSCTRQKSAIPSRTPGGQPLFSARQQNEHASAATVKPRPQSTVPVIAGSPSRRPVMKSIAATTESCTPVRRIVDHGEDTKINSRQLVGSHQEYTQGMITQEKPNPRSLVELSQARVHNLPGTLSTKVSESCPTPVKKKMVGNENIAEWSGEGDLVNLPAGCETLWDPKTDEMPSPFLVRGVRCTATTIKVP